MTSFPVFFYFQSLTHIALLSCVSMLRGTWNIPSIMFLLLWASVTFWMYSTCTRVIHYLTTNIGSWLIIKKIIMWHWHIKRHLSNSTFIQIVAYLLGMSLNWWRHCTMTKTWVPSDISMSCMFQLECVVFGIHIAQSNPILPNWIQFNQTSRGVTGENRRTTCDKK